MGHRVYIFKKDLSDKLKRVGFLIKTNDLSN